MLQSKNKLEQLRATNVVLHDGNAAALNLATSASATTDLHVDGQGSAWLMTTTVSVN
jgi:hypothetical protein